MCTNVYVYIRIMYVHVKQFVLEILRALYIYIVTVII